MKNKVLNSLIAGILGLTVGALILMLTGFSPFLPFTGMLAATSKDIYNFGEWLAYALPLIMTGLAVAFAYRTGLFNIGAEGQFIVASFVAAYVAINFSFLGPIGAMLVAMIFAGAYAGITGFLKSKFGVSEVVISIMLNYVALEVTNYLINSIYGGGKTDSIPAKASFYSESVSKLFGSSSFHWGIVFVILAVFLYWFVFKKTKFGYEIKAVGFNPFASKLAGISVPQKVFVTMFISGALAGMGGALYTLEGLEGISAISSFRGFGFDGIAIALLGQLGSIGIVVASLFISALRGSAGHMSGVPTELIDIIIGITILFSVLSGQINGLFTKIGKKLRKGADSDE